MNAQFWQGRRVLVTGHTGFKGSWLCLWLQLRGAVVTGYALEPPTDPSLFERARVAEGMTSVIADVRDADLLAAVTQEHRPEIVFHMAAQSLVRRSYESPVETYSTNVMGTVNVLEAIRRADSVSATVNVTSDKCYENRELDRGYREDEPMGGHDPYSSSKGCSELVTAAYRASFPADCGHVATARAGNVVGGGDWARDRLIADIMTAVMEGRPVRIRYPDAIRPWQHVLECVHGYIVLAEALSERGQEVAGAWNFGPDNASERPVSWIADHVTRKWGEGASWEVDEGKHPHETGQLRLNASKARNVLGWKPRLDLTTTLDWIVEWYRGYCAGEDSRQLTETKIARYEAMERGS